MSPVLCTRCSRQGDKSSVCCFPGNPNMDHRIPEPLVWYQMSSPPLGSENRKLLTSPPTCKHCVPNKNHNRNATKPFIFKAPVARFAMGIFVLKVARGDKKTAPTLKMNGLVAFQLSSHFFENEATSKNGIPVFTSHGRIPEGV